ncbi:MurR/RpiR family transcriptional regulator [Listeria seeligeri]|uniref:MurR/RpiR family transcriptional regulator n=1 Tax=Listeria seeligeri TaxID=1640 RepID=UPI0022EA695D|nr:hypothetical protein [Listeria seeligeri]
MGKINKYGLLNALLSIINNLDESNSKVIIAKYFLRNFDRIDEINIFDAADECFVTRKSIRRFAKSIGFDNFRDLKMDHEEYNYYKKQEEIPSYHLYHANQISQMVLEISKNISSELDVVIENIIACEEIVFLVSDIYSSECLEFQKKMILSGKMVRIVSFNFSENELLKKVVKDRLLFVISVSGGFKNKIDDFIHILDCKKVILTSISDKNSLANYDLVLPVGEISQPVGKTIYHTFAVEYYLDILHYEYEKKIQEKGQK